jgi:hypothetical protein
VLLSSGRTSRRSGAGVVQGMVSDLTKCWLKYRLKLAKTMNPDMSFYYTTLRVTLLISTNLFKHPEVLVSACGTADEKTIKEIHAIDELFSAEAGEYVKFLDTYMNVIPLYDDPARIKMLKDML